MFFNEADLLSVSGEKALSLNKFANLAMQEGLFSKEKQVKFALKLTQEVSKQLAVGNRGIIHQIFSFFYPGHRQEHWLAERELVGG